VVALALACALPACTIRELRLDPATPAAAPPLPAELAERFAYERRPLAPTLTALEETSDFAKSRGVYQAPCPVGGAPRATTFELWRSKHGEGPRPVVVIVPILGGKYPECDHLGRLFAGRGVHAFFVHREENLLAFEGEGADEPFEAKLRRTIVGVRRTLDWVSAEPYVDPARVGMIGISMGAIAGSFLLAAEPRIGGGVLIMGGGDLPEVIATSLETPVALWRAHKLRELDHNMGRVKALVRKLLPVDPLDYAPYVGARRVLQLVSLHDNKVPTKEQWKLWEALGRPEGHAIPIGHYTGIFYLGFAEEKALAFLDRRLAVPAAAVPRMSTASAAPTESTARPLDAMARSR